jgi:hypothetical protein
MCDNLSHQQLGRKLRVLTRHVIVISFGLSRVDPDRLESKATKKNCSTVGPLRIESIPSSHHHPVKDKVNAPVNSRITKGAGLVRSSLSLSFPLSIRLLLSSEGIDFSLRGGRAFIFQ